VCIQVPVYMTEGMATKAAAMYASLSEWASQGFKCRSSDSHPAAEAPSFAMWRPEFASAPGPCVLFATPGMLQGGISLQTFKQWAGDTHNLVLMPGMCAAGTIGSKLMAAKKTKDGRVVSIDSSTQLRVRCKV
jgi:integrator complex subunit 11